MGQIVKRDSRAWRRAAAAVLAAAVCGPTVIHAQISGSWINPFSPNSETWSNSSNWSCAPLYPDAGGTATFGAVNSYPTSVQLDTNIALAGITFDSPVPYTVTYSASNVGSITLDGAFVIDATGPNGSGPTRIATHSIGARLVGTGSLIKNGDGYVTLNGSNTFNGGVTINAGTLLINNDAALGQASVTLTLDGGCLRTGTSFVAVNRPVHVGPQGGVICSTNNNSITISNGISGDGSLLITGTGSVTGGVVGLWAPSTFSGTLSVARSLRLYSDATLLNVGTIECASGLTLINESFPYGTSSNNRLSDTAPITLRGGGIGVSNVYGNPAVTERIGTVTLEGGWCSLGASEYAMLSTPAVLRQNRALLTVDRLLIEELAPALSGGGAPGTPEVGILPWMQFQAAGLPITIEGGITRQLSASEFITAVPSGVTSSNLKLTSGGSVTSPTTVNSLTLHGGALSGPGTLTITSGAIFGKSAMPTPTTIDAPIDFGAAEGIIHTSIGGATWDWFSINGAISGSNGLTTGGAVQLNGDNTYTGPTTVNGYLCVNRDVLTGVPGPLGPDTSSVALVGNSSIGTALHFEDMDNPIRFERDLDVQTFGTGSVGLRQIVHAFPASHNGVLITGTITLNGDLSVQGASLTTGAPGMTISGRITGPGRILNPTNVILSGDNDFSGGIEMGAGTLVAGSDTAFGTGTLWLGNGAAISATGGARTLANPVVVQAAGTSSITIGGDQPITFSGDVNMFGDKAPLNIRNTATTTFAGTFFNGYLDKRGPGTLVVNRLRAAEIHIGQGVVKLMSNGTDANTCRTHRLSIADGATFDLADNKAIVDYTNFPAQNDVIRQMLRDGRLTSSSADDDFTKALGYGEASVLGVTSFGGYAVDSSSVLIKYTWKGDTNLDGQVTISDLGDFASNWQSTTAVWTDGDFNYDGAVTISDLGDLASNWQAGVGNPLGMSFEQALAAVGLGAVDVPEPGVIALFMLSTCTLKRTRRVG